MVVCFSDTVDNAVDVSALRKSDDDNPRIGYDFFANTFLQIAIQETTTRGYIRVLFGHEEYLYPMACSFWIYY